MNSIGTSLVFKHALSLQPLQRFFCPSILNRFSQISSSARVFGVLSAPAVKAKGCRIPFGIFFGIVEFGALHWKRRAF